MESSPPRRRAFEPEPVETSVRKVRRFPVEPVETSTRSSKKEAQNHPAPSLDASSAERSPPKRRFVPEPIETTFKSSRLPSNSHTNALPTPDPTPIQRTPPLAEEAKPPRPRFKPQLIETSRRSKRAGDTRPATLPTDKTDITPGTNHIYVERRKYRPPPSADATDESLASAAARLRTHAGSRPSTRQNSFQPELEVIESDEHESSSVDDEDLVESVPSLSGSYESSDESVIRQQLARTRESCDDRFSGYLLELAAKAAEKQLQEQALAAFPNETFHEIVEHFYDREVESSPSDDGSMEAVGLLPHEASIKIQPLRRQSSAEWATLEMQRHQDSLHRLREEERLATEKADTGVQPTLWNNVGAQISPFARIPEPPLDKQKEQEDKRMLKAASPPMLGSDIQFRMCPSPKATKFESDQRVDLHLNRSETGGGLWGGFCVAEEVGEYILPSVLKSPDMLQTPDREREDPFASALATRAAGTPTSSHPPSPRSSQGIHMAGGIDERLAAEMRRAKKKAAMLEEFDDGFVTQVYNYLSLGYPALARQFDEELSKIAQVSVAELRMDDEKTAHGHIGLKEADTQTAKDSARWKALKVYILEWGMAHPSLETDSAAPSAWGVRARRGSWAI